jgi:glycerate 2-kinase
MKAKTVAESIFKAAIESVLPGKMIRGHVSINGSSLFIFHLHFSLYDIKNIYVIGAGKASAIMAKEIENILEERITAGQIVVKYGHSCNLKYCRVSEGGHPLPDANGYEATKKILELAKRAGKDDLVICLISGGGSALLADTPENLSLNDIAILNSTLLKSGADIKEINTVRKHLSEVKGGQLAKAAQPATLISLILSDVIGDSVDTIASGPTAPDATTFADALHIIAKYQLLTKVPPSVLKYLKKGIEGVYPETPKPGDPIFNNTHNVIIGSNKIALEAASQKAMESGLYPIKINSELQGDTMANAEFIIGTATHFQNDEAYKKPCCLLFGGETTLRVNGNGMGGRNQHFALCAAMLLRHEKNITLLSGGTDGNDGPTDAAGAVVDPKTFENAISKKIDIGKYRDDFNSFHFFKRAGGQIVTGPTMTNVMDLIIVIIE